MARLTSADMIDIVRDYLGGETDETISDTRILRFINQSYLELCSQYQFDQLRTSTTVTTSSGTATYELSVDTLLKIDDVVDTTNNVKLYPMNESQYNKFTQGDTSTTGTPIYWFINGVGSNNRWNLTLWPTPGGTYSLTVDYTRKPTELVSSSSANTSPITPEQWDDSIIYRAVARGWAMLGEPDLHSKWRQMAMANDRAAYSTTYHPSWIVQTHRSVIAKALQDV